MGMKGFPRAGGVCGGRTVGSAAWCPPTPQGQDPPAEISGWQSKVSGPGRGQFTAVCSALGTVPVPPGAKSHVEV